jgi:hypothetical protein
MGAIVERLNQWMSVIANIGMVAGIVFLAYEIQVNTDAVRSANYASYNEVASSWGDFVAEHAADMPPQGDQTQKLSELSHKKQWVLIGFATKTFSQLEALFLNHRAGSVDDDVFEARMDTFQNVLATMPIMLEMFRNNAGGNTKEFRDFVESRIRVN